MKARELVIYLVVCDSPEITFTYVNFKGSARPS